MASTKRSSRTQVIFCLSLRQSIRATHFSIEVEGKIIGEKLIDFESIGVKIGTLGPRKQEATVQSHSTYTRKQQVGNDSWEKSKQALKTISKALKQWGIWNIFIKRKKYSTTLIKNIVITGVTQYSEKCGYKKWVEIQGKVVRNVSPGHSVESGSIGIQQRKEI